MKPLGVCSARGFRCCRLTVGEFGRAACTGILLSAFSCQSYDRTFTRRMDTCMSTCTSPECLPIFINKPSHAVAIPKHLRVSQ